MSIVEIEGRLGAEEAEPLVPEALSASKGTSPRVPARIAAIRTGLSVIISDFLCSSGSEN